MSSPSSAFELVAHRGNSAEFPENSLPAVASALQLGLRFVEIDVQLSQDLVPVVMHDHTLMRTAGRDGTVFDMTAAQLSQLDVAEPQRFGGRYAGTHIPLLGEFVALLANHPQARGFVEIKSESLERFGHEQVVSRVLAALAPCLARCIVISFDFEAIERARAAGAPSVGWVLPQWDAATRSACSRLAPDFVFVDHEIFPADERSWPGTGRWCSYEVTSAELASSLLARGVELMETRRAREALQWRRAR